MFHLIHAGNFLSITRSWTSGDKITLELPMSLRTEAIKGIVSGYLNDFKTVL